MVRQFIGSLSVLAVVSTFAAGCAGAASDQGEEMGLTNSAIIGGGIDEGHPAVAFLLFDVTLADGTEGTANCTGTLIAPKVILTAGHCVTPELRNGRVFFGTRGGEAKPSDFIKVASSQRHPDYNETKNVNPDVAVLILERAVTTIQPMPFLRAAIPAKAAGVLGTAVGFGNTIGGVFASGNFTKKRVSVRLDAIAADSIDYGKPGSTTCQGDSGGPELFIVNGKETIVSVTSRGPANCVDFSTGTRVDRFLDFIDPFLADAAPAGDTPAPTMTPTTPANGASCDQVEAEPNATADSANRLVANGTTCGAVGKTDKDFFDLQGSRVNAVFEAENDAVLTLRYPGGQQQSGSGVFQVTAAANSTFSFEVTSPSGTPQAYRIRLQ